MNEVDTKPDSETWGYLRELGFAANNESPWTPQVERDFGTFVLEANLSMNRYFRQAVIFGANYRTAREIGEIAFELPPDLDSVEQCGAMIHYYLRHYQITKTPDWFDAAKENQNLLPWNAAKTETPSRSESRTVIPIRVECRHSDRGGGAWWKIVDLFDDRHALPLGDCGVYEYDAEVGAPEKVVEYVLNTLGEAGEFEDQHAIYIVDVTFLDSGTELASSTNRFRYKDTLDWPFRSHTVDK